MAVESSGTNFQQDSQMTFQEVYDFAFKGLIPIFKNLAAEIGEAQFVETIKRISSELALQGGEEGAKEAACNDLHTLTTWAREPNHFWKHVLDFEIIEDTNAAFEVRVSNCLWAKTFRENDAAEIGAALICHADYATCRGFNPNIRLERTKTLMQGDECCNHRWIFEQENEAVSL